MSPEKKRLGEMLIEAGLIDELQLSSALGEQRKWGGRLGSLLIKMGFVDEQMLASVLEKQLGEKCISLKDMEIPQEVLNAVKSDIAKKYWIMPIAFEKKALTIATSDPTDLKTLDNLSFMLGVRVKPVLALESDIKSAIARHYEGIMSEGKTYKVDIKKVAERVQVMREEIIEKPAEKKEITTKAVIEALIAVLIEKGIITREELATKIKEKSR